jgi:pimeloyl-ACP methyl ester carboxylesterase
MPSPSVLVPGACLGAWAWRRVAPALREQGHEVHPLSLTGLGDRAHLARPDVDLDTHITDVVNLLDYEDLADVVLVGHSYAGAVIPGVADRRPARVRKVVYLDTGPLPDGGAISDLQSDEERERQRAEVEAQGDGWRWPVPGREVLRSGIYGSAAGLSDHDIELIERLGTPQPYATFTSPLRLSGPRSPSLQRAAIFCSEGGLDVEQARELIAQGDPRLGPFLDGDWELRGLPTGHWSMFSAPGALAELLHELAG